jgi:hypothetical protein
VTRFLEQVCVGIEGHARSGVAKDAADLDDVEADIDDQVAGEGVAQIVEAHPSARPIEAGVAGSPAEHALGDVVVQEGGAMRGREHVVRFGSEA